MESTLSSDEMNALQSLDPDKAAGAARYRDGDFPQRLFAFNLVTRQPSGATVLTKNGERTLFRHSCLAALQGIERGASARIAAGVQKWLLASGFIEAGSGPSAAPAITQRGKLWLDSFKADAAVVEQELTAADFARRRA
jgi:hypothetical protein